MSTVETLPIPYQLFPLLLLATIAQRLLELRLSRFNQQAMMANTFERKDSEGSFVKMLAVHLSWFVALTAEHLLFPSRLPDFAGWIALICYFAAQLLRIWAIRSLGVQWNVNVMTPQAGQLAPPEFVANGPYRYIRHPNYLAVISEFIALPILARAPITAIIWSIANGLILKGRIAEEEASLFLRPGYRELMGSRPRLIPGVLGFCRKN